MMNRPESTIVFLMVVGAASATEGMIHGDCTCAVFSGPAFVPLLEHSIPLNVSCDEEGSDKCLRLCVAIADGAKERGPALICEKLDGHAKNLKFSVHGRVCRENWRFTGLEETEGICCHGGKEIPCDSLPRE